MRVDAQLHGSSTITNGFVASSIKNKRLIPVAFIIESPPGQSAMSKLWQITKKIMISDAILEIVKGCDQKDHIVDAQTCQIGKLRVKLLLKGLSDIKFPRNNVLKNWLAGSIPARDQQITLRSRVGGQLAWLITKIHGWFDSPLRYKYMVADNQEIKEPHINLNSTGNHKNPLYLSLCQMKSPLFDGGGF